MIVRVKNNQPSDTLRIEYMLGNLCNHKCHYCFPGSNEGDQPWPDIDIVKQNLGHLLEHYRNNGKPKSNIFFVGGEPTLWKGLPELCTYLKQEFGTLIEMSSNGSKALSWWDREAHNFDNVGISVHHEYAKLDKIIKVCDLLYERGVFVNADVLIDPYHFDKCVDIVEYLKKFAAHKWPIIAKIVHFSGMHRYTDEQLKYFDDTIKQYPDMDWYHNTVNKEQTRVEITQQDGEVIVVDNDSWITRNNLNYFKGWQCNLGVDLLKIFGDGRITGNCQQVLYGADAHYNIYDSDFASNFNPNIEPVTCTKRICGCNEEVVCNKWIS